MSLLSQTLGGLGVLGGIGRSLDHQNGAPIPYPSALAMGNLPLTYVYDMSAWQNAAPRPEPSVHDEDLWICDPRPLTFEEWSAERYGR